MDGRAVQLLRQRLGITQLQLAEVLFAVPNQLSGIELGRYRLDFDPTATRFSSKFRAEMLRALTRAQHRYHQRAWPDADLATTDRIALILTQGSEHQETLLPYLAPLVMPKFDELMTAAVARATMAPVTRRNDP